MTQLKTTTDTSWEAQLEAKELEIAHVKWGIDRDYDLLVKLQTEQKELCSEVGHEWDENFVQCINCSDYNPRQWDEPELDDV